MPDTLCTDPACSPGAHSHLSMPDRVPNGEPINDAIARMQAAQRSQRIFEAMFSHAPRVDTRTPADIRNGVTLI